MKSKTNYINVVYSLFLASFIILIGFSTNWNLLSSAIFSIVFMIYFSWQAIKKFKQRNEDIIFDYKWFFAVIGLMLLIAGTVMFIGTTFKGKPVTKHQKERLIVK